MRLMLVAFLVVAIARWAESAMAGFALVPLLSGTGFGLMAIGLYAHDHGPTPRATMGRMVTAAGVLLVLAAIALRHWP